MMTGSTPARAKETNRARGRNPSSLALSSLMIRTAAAPSEICDELPAVTSPSSLKAGWSVASFSREVSRRIPSSWRTSLGPGLAADGDRHDLGFEASLLRGPAGSLVGIEADLVELGAGQAPLLTDHLGRQSLGDEAVAVALEHERAKWHARALLGGDAHRDPGHRLDAGRDHYVVGPRHDALGGEMGSLLGGSALAVDGGADDFLRKTGCQSGVAGDVETLLAGLGDTAHDHVLDQRRVDAGSVDQRLEGDRGQVDGMDVLELPVPLGDRRPHRIDDDSIGIESSLNRTLTLDPGRNLETGPGIPNADQPGDQGDLDMTDQSGRLHLAQINVGRLRGAD